MAEVGVQTHKLSFIVPSENLISLVWMAIVDEACLKVKGKLKDCME
jgi:hypothetical protein